MGRQVLVTGSRGYIGALLTNSLTRRGHSVTGLDCEYYRGCGIESGGDNNKRADIRKDIRDVSPHDLEGHDTVIHLAALSNDPLGDIRRDLTIDINVVGTERLIEACRAAEVERFIYASSCSVYGDSGGEWVDEESQCTPLTAYAESKVRSEELLDEKSGEMKTASLRCATVYGYSPMLRLDLVVNNLAAWGYTTDEVKVLSDGEPWRPLIDVKDLVDAYVWFVEEDSWNDLVVNVGFTEENYKIREVANQIAMTVPGAEAVVAGDGSADQRSYRVRFDQFQGLTNIRPDRGIRGAVAELLDEFEQVGLQNDDLNDRRYVRLEQIQYLQDESYVDDELRVFSAPGSGRW